MCVVRIVNNMEATMAKLTYTYLSDLQVQIELTPRELETLSNALKSALTRDDSTLGRYSAEAALFDQLTEVTKEAIRRLESDIAFHTQYSVSKVTARELIEARTGEAA